MIIYYVITGNEIAALGPRRKEEKFVPRDYRGLIESYEMRLKSFIEEKFGNALTSVRLEQKVEFGTPEKSIVEIANAEAVDLIIMASRGKRGLIRMFLGSVTEEVIRNAPCPVIAVPRSRRKPVELCPRRRKKESNAVKGRRIGRPSQVDRRIAERHH